MAEQALIRRWLTQLGKLTVGVMSGDAAADYLDAFVPMLAMRFDNGAFTPVSLEHVAAGCKYLPTYGELVPMLQAWRRGQRESERIEIEYAGRSGQESTEPYQPPPPPDWCHERESRLDQGGGRPELNIRPPRYTVAQQIALLNGEPVPLKAAATDVAQEVKRGPVLVEDEPEC